MTYTYTLSSEDADTKRIAQVRLLVPDNQGEANAVFEDEELAAFLELEGDNIYFAAAQALDTIANDINLTYKSIETMDVVVDAVSAAKEFRYRSAVLRSQGAQKEPDSWQSIGLGDALEPNTRSRYPG